MVQASTMKWMDLSLNGSGCHWGIYSRDGNFLRSFPRMTDHIVMSAANRCVCLCATAKYQEHVPQNLQSMCLKAFKAYALHERCNKSCCTEVGAFSYGDLRSRRNMMRGARQGESCMR